MVKTMYKKRKEYIEAMKETAIEYINGTHTFSAISCKLCTVSASENGLTSCYECPWVILTKNRCNKIDKSEYIARATELLEWVAIYEDGADFVEPVKFNPFKVTIDINSEEMAHFWFTICGRVNDIRVPGSEGIYDEIKAQMDKQNIPISCVGDIRPFGHENWHKCFKEQYGKE